MIAGVADTQTALWHLFDEQDTASRQVGGSAKSWILVSFSRFVPATIED
jgi:hypothetical protein